jgi:hypothetical protein
MYGVGNSTYGTLSLATASIKECSNEDLSESALSFSIFSPEESFIVSATTTEMKFSWIEKIGTCIKKSQDMQSTLSLRNNTKGYI